MRMTCILAIILLTFSLESCKTLPPVLVQTNVTDTLYIDKEIIIPIDSSSLIIKDKLLVQLLEDSTELSNTINQLEDINTSKDEKLEISEFTIYRLSTSNKYLRGLIIDLEDSLQIQRTINYKDSLEYVIQMNEYHPQSPAQGITKPWYSYLKDILKYVMVLGILGTIVFFARKFK